MTGASSRVESTINDLTVQGRWPRRPGFYPSLVRRTLLQWVRRPLTIALPNIHRRRDQVYQRVQWFGCVSFSGRAVVMTGCCVFNNEEACRDWAAEN